MINNEDGVVLVKADSPYRSLKDLVKDAKARPGAITLAHAGLGGTYHLNALIWEMVTGARFKLVPFKGASEINATLSGGHVEVGSGTFSDSRELLKGGKLRALAIAAKTRDVNFPEVPTFEEQGFGATTTSVGPRFLIAPKGIPKNILNQLEEGVAKANQTEVMKKFWKTSGYREAYMNKTKSVEYLREIEKVAAEAYKAHKEKQ